MTEGEAFSIDDLEIKVIELPGIRLNTSRSIVTDRGTWCGTGLYFLRRCLVGDVGRPDLFFGHCGRRPKKLYHSLHESY